MEAIEVIQFNDLEGMKDRAFSKDVFDECVMHTMNLAQTDNAEAVIQALKETNIHIGVFIRKRILHVVLVPVKNEISTLFKLITNIEYAAVQTKEIQEA